jgi:hypothetical protein
MIFKSPIFAQASGSLAGTVFSHNQGGMYVRARATPTNPNTEAQQAVRDALRTAVFNWSNVLTSAERDSWNTYAFNTPTFNRLGEATHKTGQQMYVRGTVSRIQAALPLSPPAPTTFDLGDFTPPSAIIADASADTISIAFNDADGWANEVGGALLIYQSRPQNPTRIFGKGPYQLATAILGSVGAPPTSPSVFTSLFGLSTGQRLFLKFVATRVDNRLSSPTMTSTIVVA